MIRLTILCKTEEGLQELCNILPVRWRTRPRVGHRILRISILPHGSLVSPTTYAYEDFKRQPTWRTTAVPAYKVKKHIKKLAQLQEERSHA